MQCDICGHDGIKIRQLNRTYGKGSDLWILENVPHCYCPQCHETSLTADTLHEIERLKLHHQALADKRLVAVVKFAG